MDKMFVVWMIPAICIAYTKMSIIYMGTLFQRPKYLFTWLTKEIVDFIQKMCSLQYNLNVL